MSGRDSRTEFMEYEFCPAVRVLLKSKNAGQRVCPRNGLMNDVQKLE